MRRLVFFLILIASISCTREGSIITKENSQLRTKSVPSSFVVTEDMARAFIAFAYPNKHIASVSSVSEEGVPLLWIVNFDEGWSIISADKRANIILAQNKEGNYHYGESIPPVDTWIAGYAKEIKAITQSEWEGCNESLDIWEAVYPTFLGHKPSTKADETNIWVRTTIGQNNTYLDSTFVPHLMITKWGQEYPWNENVPYYINNSTAYHYPTGCVAVAVGQTLYYMHYKDSIPQGLYETVYNNQLLQDGGINDNFQHQNYVNPSLRWDYMATEYPSTNNYSYVADLLGDICHEANTSYGILGSSAGAPVSVYTHYGLTCSNDSVFDFQTAFSEIQSSYPVSIGAKGYLNNIEHKHYFVADGCISRLYRTDVYYVWHLYPDWDYINNNGIPVQFYLTDEDMQTYDPNMYDGKQTISSTYNTYKYLYMNWGYYGNFDNTECGVSFLDHWTANGINYDYNRRMIYNIR